MPNFFPIQTSELKFEEPKAFRRFSFSLVEMALVTGVLHNVLDEFYRRYGAPYEDQQIIKNGDVYPEQNQ